MCFCDSDYNMFEGYFHDRVWIKQICIYQMQFYWKKVCQSDIVSSFESFGHILDFTNFFFATSNLSFDFCCFLLERCLSWVLSRSSFLFGNPENSSLELLLNLRFKASSDLNTCPLTRTSHPLSGNCPVRTLM